MMSGAADSNSNLNGRASDEQILGSAGSSSSWIPTGSFPNNNEDDDSFLDYFLSGETGLTPEQASVLSNSSLPITGLSPQTQRNVNTSALQDQTAATTNTTKKKRLFNATKSVNTGVQTPAVQFYASSSSKASPPKKSLQPQMIHYYHNSSSQTQQGQQRGHGQGQHADNSTAQRQHQPTHLGTQQGQPGIIPNQSAPVFSTIYPTPNLAPANGNSNPASASSSSSSLSSIAVPPGTTATTNGSGHSPLMMHVHHHFNAQALPPASYVANGISPISPAGMIGAGGELMMLPPPPRFPIGSGMVDVSAPAGANVAANTAQWHIPQLSHNDWLQQMNSMAANAQMTRNSIVANQNNQKISTFPTPQGQVFSVGTAMQSKAPGPSQHVYVHPMPQTDILPIPHNMNLNAINQTSAYDPNALESKEKRERRLARNRESARQSRRRKKELLLNLRSQVNKLHSDIEAERRRQFSIMESQLVADRDRVIQEALDKILEEDMKECIDEAVRDGGPNSARRRATAAFQYNALRQLILPIYQQFFFAVSLNTENFFTSAKESRMKSIKGTGRVSSKQVGEDISINHKNAVKTGEATGNVSCRADDAEKLWPLLCYELSVSLDQEEKFIQVFKRTRQNGKVPQTRSQISIAATMVNNLKNGVLYQCHSAGHRSEAALLQVLTPAQTGRYLAWHRENKSRCVNLLDSSPRSGANDHQFRSYDNSLNDVCQQLTEAMKINTKQTTV